LNVSTLEQVKLEKVVAGTVRSKKVPVFTASKGVEGLFHVVNKFNKAAARLQFQVGDYWDPFEDVLDSTAENKRTNQVAWIAAAARTLNQFYEVEMFINGYTGSREPHDILIKYIKS
jgi:hypothetical protein